MNKSKSSEWTPSLLSEEEELSDVFYTNERKGHLIHVKLNRNGITLQKNNKEKIIKIGDIVGGRCVINKSNNFSSNCGCSSLTACSTNYGNRAPNYPRELSAYFHVFAYVLRPNLRNIVRRERTVLVLRFCSFDTFEENMQEAERWSKTLNLLKRDVLNLGITTTNLKPIRRRILFFLNPKSGSGKARRLFHRYAVPVLNEADLLYDLHVTKHINYAKEFVRQRDLRAWSSIIAIGGDGLFFEILNGLLKRTDWKQIIESISLGIIPCGSGNGLAKSISHIYNEPYEPRPILSATLTIVRGYIATMDVVRLELKNQILYSFLSVGWGFISDIDIESERLRSLGHQRFTLWSLHRLVSLRTYRGRISYLPKKFTEDMSSIKNSDENSPQISVNNFRRPYRASNKDIIYKSTEYMNKEIGTGSRTDDISLQTSLTRSFRSGLESWRSDDSCESMYYSIAESIYRSIPSEKEPNEDGISILSGETTTSCGPIAMNLTLEDPIPENWIIEEGEFVMAQATYQTHLSTDCHFSPSSTLNDGTIYLVIIRGGIKRSQLLQFLLNLSSGTHIPLKKDEFIKVVAVSAFRFEPEDQNGILTVDGERVEFGSIQGALIPELARLIVPN